MEAVEQVLYAAVLLVVGQEPKTIIDMLSKKTLLLSINFYFYPQT